MLLTNLNIDYIIFSVINMKKSKTAVYILFFCYTALMIWLLFLQRIPYLSFENYADKLLSNVNFIPFRTIAEYALTDINAEPGTLRHAVINLAGNIVMFIPLGFFLPLIFEKCVRFKICMLFFSLIILIVELIQLFTLTGSFDVDDLILNLIGSAIGYKINRLIFKNKH